MRARILIVIVAVVLGMAAAMATYGYLSALRTEAEAGSVMTEVLIAKDDLPRGASAEDLVASGAIERVQIPQRYVASGAISSTKAVADKILALPVSKGEVLTSQRFQYPAEAGLAFNVPKGFVAVTVPVDEAHGLAGLLKSGDRVAVVATIDTKTDMGQQTRITVPGARVLAVGRSTDTAQQSGQAAQAPQGGVLSGEQTQGGQQAMTTVTLALSAADAEKVVFAAAVGEVWLALLPATESAAGPGPGQTAATVLR